MINDIAMWVGYAVIGVGGLALFLHLMWYFVGQTIKLLGYWPLFYKTMMRVAYERNTRKKKDVRS